MRSERKVSVNNALLGGMRPIAPTSKRQRRKISSREYRQNAKKHNYHQTFENAGVLSHEFDGHIGQTRSDERPCPNKEPSRPFKYGPITEM